MTQEVLKVHQKLMKHYCSSRAGCTSHRCRHYFSPRIARSHEVEPQVPKYGCFSKHVQKVALHHPFPLDRDVASLEKRLNTCRKAPPEVLRERRVVKLYPPKRSLHQSSRTTLPKHVVMA